jgi:hypothetical protein
MTDLDIQSPGALADWIETSVLVSSSGHFGRDRLVELASEEIDATPAAVGSGLALMARRAAILGESYPFVVNDLAVLRATTDLTDYYAALLFLSPDSVARQAIDGLLLKDMTELFEVITESALANLWGPGGEAITFGFPSRHGRPEAFDQAVIWLAEKIGLTPGIGYRPPYRKDGGVDVVAWRQFADRRPGFPIALAQCTIQRETFTKTTDIDLRLWASWLAMDFDPTSLLVIPGTIRSSGPDWQQLSTVVTVIERVRLIELLARTSEGRRELLWAREIMKILGDILKSGEL